jgi:hypothetical protein
MSKFLLKILLQISKALVNSKIQFLIQKFFFLAFGEAHSAVGPAGPANPFLSRAETTLAGPPSLCAGRVFTEVCFPFWFAPFKLAASPSSLCQAGPGCQLRPSPPAARARPCRHRFPPTPRRPTSDLEMLGEVFTPRHESPP